MKEEEPEVKEEEPEEPSAKRPKRTPARKEKQRLASAKSRKKKKSEGNQLKRLEEDLNVKNNRLRQRVNKLEADKELYMAGEKSTEDSQAFYRTIIDLDDPDTEEEN